MTKLDVAELREQANRMLGVYAMDGNIFADLAHGVLELLDECNTYRLALEDIAMQKTTAEIDGEEFGDIDFGYDSIIHTARAALDKFKGEK